VGKSRSIGAGREFLDQGSGKRRNRKRVEGVRRLRKRNSRGTESHRPRKSQKEAVEGEILIRGGLEKGGECLERET